MPAVFHMCFCNGARTRRFCGKVGVADSGVVWWAPRVGQFLLEGSLYHM